MTDTLKHAGDRPPPPHAPRTDPGNASGGWAKSATATPLTPEADRHSPWGRLSHGTAAGRGALLLAGIGLGLVGIHAIGVPTPECPLRSVTGMPCPFCGLTHLARDLIGGQVGLVAAHDPAGLVLAGALVVAVIAQLVAMVRRITGPAFMTSRVVGAVVLAALAIHWVTTIITGGLLVL